MAIQDDPRLTAYVLGELDAAEQAEVEALLAQSAEARATVTEIEETVGLLEAQLGAGPEPDPKLRDAVLAPTEPSGSKAKWLWASGLVAAAAAVGLFVVQQDKPASDGIRVKGAPRSAASVAYRGGSEAAARRRAEIKAKMSLVAKEAPATPRSAAPATAAPATAAPQDTEAAARQLRRARMSRAMRKVKNRDLMLAQKDLFAEAASEAADDAMPPTPVTADSLKNSKHPNWAVGKSVGKKGPLPPHYWRGDKNIDQLHAGLIAPYREAPMGGNRHLPVPENVFQRPLDTPLSTFSIDVDTASYSMTRSHLTRGRTPPRGAVRIEELINYFEYDYAPPVDGRPFATHVDVTSAPWRPENRLVRIGLKGAQVDRARANLVFLLDVSGSMSARNKLPLLKQAMRTLVDNLRPDDRVAIVVYAGASGLVLPSTPAKNKRAILGALDRLKSGGGTNGGAGIKQAYWVAAQNYVQGGINRVIIGTDGDFNVGTTSHHALVQMVEQRAQGGIALTVLGFGMGNYNDMTLEQLADKGDGNYAYIDTIQEARKVLVDQLDGTLTTIAKDVKIQVEFNPAQVAAYRLIGYENRKLAAQDFNDDTKDAGEIGAGHTVTALYEVVPTGRAPGVPVVDPLKYQPERPPPPASPELLTVKLRYKAPTGGPSTLIEQPVIDTGKTFSDASADLRFAASVAAFGMLLRHSPHAGSATMSAVLGWAENALGKDEWGYRQGFLELVRRARRSRR